MTIPPDRGYIEFTDGRRLYATPREQPCLCDENQLCAFHATYKPVDLGVLLADWQDPNAPKPRKDPYA